LRPSLHTAPLVLIVDDDEGARLLAEITLTGAGFRTVQACDGKEALEVFQSGAPDIVLLDVNMPGMDGFETCRRLRKLATGATVPVLMLTGHEDVESIDRAYEAGATDFLTKATNRAIIAYRVRYMLRASRAVSELARSQRSLITAQRVARMGSWEWRADADRFFLSEEILHMFGLKPEDFSGTYADFMRYVHRDDHAAVRAGLKAAIRGRRPYNLHHRVVMQDGSVRRVHAQAEIELGHNGRVARICGTVQDVTERLLAEDKIRRLAYYDSLTALPNRTLFREQLTRALAQSKRWGGMVAVMFVDLDNFKRINDTLGHSVGDQLLTAAAERIATCVRSGETVGRNINDSLAGTDADNASPVGSHVGRQGGDEFTLFLSDLAQPSDAARVAQRILGAMERPFSLGRHEVVVGASIGIAVSPDAGDDTETLLRNADAAMYHAKGLGRNNYQYYTHSMNAEAMQKLSLETGLRKALEHGEFVLHYQPIVEVASGNIVGAEALVRWQHPTLGLVAPMDFIPLAEESGLIVPLSEWILDTACRQAAAWQRDGLAPLRVAVNLSGAHLRQQAVPQTVARALQAGGLEPRWLRLELSETMMMRDVDTTLPILHELRDMGVHLAVNDFGIGYASLIYLRRFSLLTLKIDRAFVHDLPDDPEVAAITLAVVAMARSLKLTLAAAGVETREQLEFLRQQGCDEYQGDVFSAALPAQAFSEFVARCSGAAGRAAKA